MPDSNKAAARRKPAKPHKDFPLFPHATGRWAKKVRQKLVYFGKIADDPDGQAALAKWLEEKDDLLAGRKPRPHADGVTVEDTLDVFLNGKKPLVASGEITQRTLDEYRKTCERVGKAFGMRRLAEDLRPEDFEALRCKMAERWGPVTVAGEITRVRVLFKYVYEAGLLDRPMRYGPGFKRPSRKTLRIERAKKGLRMFEAAEVRLLLDAAGPSLRAMILLAVNCGFGNGDCGALPLLAVDLERGWLNFPRPKTGIERRCKIWPETVGAIRDVLAARKEPKDAAVKPLLFVTKYGQSWGKEVADSPITKETRKLLDDLKIYRPGLGFYALRHTFATIGGESRDAVAVSAIMGHIDSSMAGTYRERISDERLAAVADHVRRWLFGVDSEGDAAGGQQ